MCLDLYLGAILFFFSMVFPDCRWDFSAEVDISLINNECANFTFQEQMMPLLRQLISGVFRSLSTKLNYQEYISPYHRLLTKKGFAENIDNIFSCNLWQSTHGSLLPCQVENVVFAWNYVYAFLCSSHMTKLLFPST